MTMIQRVFNSKPFASISELMQHPLLKHLHQRYDAISQRDQIALQIMMLFVAIAALYFLIWQPIDDWSSAQHKQYLQQQHAQQWLNEQLPIAKKQLAQQKNQNGKKTITTVTTLSAKKIGIELEKVQPTRDGLSVLISAIPYQTLLKWLVMLQQEDGATVQTIKLEALPEQGMIKAQLTLAL